PAVQAARESARRAQCQNNLKQLGVALHNYQSAHRHFPYAGSDYGWCKFPQYAGAEVIRNTNGLLLLLPYLEQQAIYDRFDWDNAAYNSMEGNDLCCPPTKSLGTLLGDADISGNSELSKHILAVLLCPSDVGEVMLESEGAVGAKTNYDFSTSNIYDCGYWSRSDNTKQRMFGENSDARPASITDGLSNTVAMAETMRDVANGRAAAWCYRSWLTPGIDIAGFEINRWQMPELVDDPRRTQLANWGHAGSLHGDGAYVLMADGSTHYLSEEADRTVRERLSMITDGEIVEAP
ncbi:MAG: DUF1559 domain-containing protein, partial [Bythopirellula sp.]